MFQVVTGKVKAFITNEVKLAREAAAPIVNTSTQTVTAAGTVLASVTVPDGATYSLSEVSVGGDTANRVDVVIGGTVVHTMFYPSYGMNHKTYGIMPKAAAGQTIQVISRLATSGSHSATLLVQGA